MGKTLDNLKAAFAGESQANRKYLAFARKADDEGYGQAARLFRAAAEAETVHAHNHLRIMGGVGTTAENLREGIAGEHHEVVAMYPAMMTEAQAEGEAAALQSFTWAHKVEETHEALYQKALEALAFGPATMAYYVCQGCGHTHEGFAPEKCPVCGAPASRFLRVD